MPLRVQEDEFFEVLYCPGSVMWLSDEAKEEYLRLTGRYIRTLGETLELRTDPVLIDVVKRLGQRASHRRDPIEVCKIPESYSDYWRIDGEAECEAMTIDYSGYKLDFIKHLVANASEFSKASLVEHILYIIEEPNLPDIPQSNYYS